MPGSLAERRARAELYRTTLDLLQNLPASSAGADQLSSDGDRRRMAAGALRDLMPDLSRLGSGPVNDLILQIATSLARGAPHDRYQIVAIATLIAAEIDTAPSVPRELGDQDSG